MMENKITESSIEKYSIEHLEKQGYDYIYGPDIAPDSDNPERESFENVILIDRLRQKISQLNPDIPDEVLADALKQVLRISSPDLIANNEAFHNMLTQGIKVSYRNCGITKN